MNKLEKAAILSILGNAFISALKFSAGTMFGSIALVADAMHSFTDIISSIAVFLGIRFSSVKSGKFPYGLYKLENLASLFISFAIFYAGFEIASNSLSKIADPEQIISMFPIGIALFSAVFVFVLAKYKGKIGREEHSPSMLSDARHSMVDVLSSLGVLAGVSLNFIGLAIFDPLAGLLVSLLVFAAGARILRDSAKVLLDASLDYKTMKKIEDLVKKQKTVKVKELIARNSGRYVFVDLKLETGVVSLKAADKIRQECETAVKKAVPKIDRIMIDVEYKKKPFTIFAVPLKKKKKESGIATEFGIAAFFGIIKVDNKTSEIISSKIIKNPHAKAERKRGILTAELLVKKEVNVLLSKKEMHKGGAFYALQDNFIEVKHTKSKTFSAIIKGLSEQKWK